MHLQVIANILKIAPEDLEMRKKGGTTASFLHHCYADWSFNVTIGHYLNSHITRNIHLLI